MKRATCSALLLAAAGGLQACTSTPDVLEPSALVDSQTAQPPVAAPALPAPSAATDGEPAQQSVAAIRTDARIQFAPVVGATGDASAPLAARLSARAAERGIRLVGAGDTSATHVMKGYFSAISDGDETTVIYVWDVLDPAGARVHRIQGQAKAPAAGGDGWSSVQAGTMEAIADQTVDQLAAWLGARQG